MKGLFLGLQGGPKSGAQSGPKFLAASCKIFFSLRPNVRARPCWHCEWLWWPQALFILAFCSKKVAPGGPKCGPMWGLSFWILGLKIKHEGLVFGAAGWAQKWGPIWSQIPSSKPQNRFFSAAQCQSQALLALWVVICLSPGIPGFCRP